MTLRRATIAPWQTISEVMNTDTCRMHIRCGRPLIPGRHEWRVQYGTWIAEVRKPNADSTAGTMPESEIAWTWVPD